MKTKTKGISAAIIFIISIGVYYYLIQGIEWFWSDFCANSNSCMKTLSLAEFLSIEVALIGMYFVVSTLDDWKKQDQYQVAKANILKLHNISSILKKFNEKISDFDNLYSRALLNPSNTYIEKTDNFLIYEDYKNNLKIEEDIRQCSLDIKDKAVSLHQNHFESCVDLAKEYLKDINNEILNLNSIKASLINEIIEKNLENKEIINKKIENQKDGFLKEFLLISNAVNNINNQKNGINNFSDLDISSEEFRAIVKNNELKFQDFTLSLKKLQKNLNDFV